MIRLRNGGMGLEISDDYTTNLGNPREVFVTVRANEDGTFSLNVGSTSDLNKSGRQALKNVLAMAEAIIESGGVILN